MTTKTIHNVEIFATGEWNGRAYDGDDLAGNVTRKLVRAEFL